MQMKSHFHMKSWAPNLTFVGILSMKLYDNQFGCTNHFEFVHALKVAWVCCLFFSLVYHIFQLQQNKDTHGLLFHLFFFRHLRVPVPLPRCLYHLQYLVVVYFLCAVGFNIAEIVQLLLYNRASSTSIAPVANQTLTSLNASTSGNSSLTSLHNRQWRLHDVLINNGTL